MSWIDYWFPFEPRLQELHEWVYKTTKNTQYIYCKKCGVPQTMDKPNKPCNNKRTNT